MTKAVQLGLRFDRHDTASQLLLLNQAHTEYWPRYPMKTANPVFVISEFEPNGDDLFQSILTALDISRYPTSIREFFTVTKKQIFWRSNTPSVSVNFRVVII